MATIGSLVIGLSLGTAGLAMGLNNVEAQIKGFQNRINGQTAITAQAAAYQQVQLAQDQVTVSQQKLAVSQARLTELQAQGSASASSLAAANLAVSQSSSTLASAQTTAAGAQAAGAAAVTAAQERLFLAQARLSISTIRLTEIQGSATASAASMAAAQLNVTRNTMAVAAAQRGVSAAQVASTAGIAAAQNAVVVAQERLNISTLRLTELQTRGGAAASTLAAAQLGVTRSTQALTAAQTQLAGAQTLAANPAPRSTWGGHFPFITAAVTIAGYAMVMFAANTVRAASAFEAEMRLIQTQAAATREEVDRLSDSILKMAPSLQTSPMDLSKSMFRFKSVGLDEANALEAMTWAAKGARVGNASLDSVTTALIATMISGIDGITSWSQAMGVLNGIVGVSNLRMEDLTNSLSSGILSTAKQFGLDIIDVGSALAVMSNQAVPAEEGATRLRISIALLAAPTAIATRELAKIGLTQRQIADQMRGEGGLLGALTLLKSRMDAAGLDAVEQSMLLKTAFGGSRSSAGILLLMNSLDDLGTMYAAVQAKAGSFADDWAAQSDTAAAKFATFSATVDVLSIRIGNGLLPVMTTFAAILGFVADKTIIMVPLFYLIITAIGITLVKAIWGAVAGLVTMVAHMAMNVVAGIAMRALFSNMGPIIAGNMAIGGAGVAGFNVQMAAANLAAAGFVSSMGGAIGAAGGVGAATGAAAVPVSALGGAMGAAAATAAPLVAGMAATAAASAPLVAGMSGAAGAMAATAAMSGPLVAGMATASGAMIVTAGSTGPLVAGLAGADGAMIATAATTGPLVAGMVTASGAMAATAVTTGALILPLAATGPAGAAAAAGIAATGWAAAAATPAVAGLGIAVAIAGLPIWAIAAIVLVIIGVLVLLVLNIDKVIYVFKRWWLGNVEMVAGLLNLLSMLPVVGDQFKGLAADVEASAKGMKEELAGMELKFNNESAVDPLGDISKLVQLQIDKAKAEANSAFNDLNDTLIDLYGTSMQGVQAAAYLAGTKDMQEYAKGIGDAVNLPKDAFSTLVEALKVGMTPEQEAARLIGELQSKELADGLASGSPYVVATAEALKKSILDRLNEISDGAYAASQLTWEQWYRGWYDAQVASGAGTSEITMELKTGGLERLQSEFAALKAQWTNSLAPTPEEARAAMEALRLEISNGTASVTDAAKAFVAQFGYSLSALKDVGATAGADMMNAIADEIESKSDAVMTAISKLHDVITNGLSTAAQEAFLLAALAGEDIANGLASAEPDVYARAVAARDIIIAQLDFLSAGAFSKGSEAAKNWATGYVNQMGMWVPPQTGPAPDNSLGLTADQLAAGKSSYQKYLDSLSSSTSSFTAQYKSDMTAAFNEIKAKALEYFDAVHERNLRAIKDAHDHRDALLEAKQALNQAPVTAAQKALDAQRREIQEWRLRQAVATASTPEEQRDAVLALRDFLAQKHIDEMQAQVDDANDVIEAKKKANDDQEAARIEAENERYQKQKKDFQRNLTALEAYLKNHPEAWRKTQNEILALLNEYGVSYKNVGNLLGADFATGLRDQVKAAADAGTALANAAGTAIQDRADQIAAAAAKAAAAGAAAVSGIVTHPYNENGPGRAGGGPVYKGQPAWVGEAGREVFVPETDGFILNHADSLKALNGIQPAASPISLDTIRRATERPAAPTGNAMVDVTASRASEGVSGGKTTVIFQVGERVFGEMADISMYQQKAMRERNSVTKVGASRR